MAHVVGRNWLELQATQGVVSGLGANNWIYYWALVSPLHCEVFASQGKFSASNVSKHTR